MKAQFVALLGSRLLAAGLQAVAFILFARLAGAEEVGVIGVVVGVGIVLATLADLGLSPYISRSRALGESAKVRTGLRLNIASTALFGILFGAGVFIATNSTSTALSAGAVMVAVSVAFEKNSDTLLSLAYADQNKWIPAASILSRRVASLIALVVLLTWTPAVVAYGAAQLLGAVVGQIVTRLSLRSTLRAITGPFVSAPAALRESVDYLVNALSAQARNLDVPVVAAVAGPTVAGYYSAAVRLLNPLLLIPATLTSLILPHASKASAVHKRRLTLQLTLGGLSLYLLVVPAALLAPAIVDLLFGEAFAPAGPALAWLLIALPVIGLSSPLASLVQASSRARTAAVISASSAVLAIVAVAVGTAVAGATGAAIGTGIAFALKCIALLLVVFANPRTEL